ncbi:hypothetical protein LMF57_00735 [Stenotrophomonas sp. SI-NJAU-1]|uniref:hypothetical protein n=1 Tax=Stenotrophomonas TaxID=40323 RepID=UPI000E3E25BD|nr:MULTISPECIES: hypothetical protein [Stenotrophomonas]MDT9583362.1 hypothetical protein [Stenotrophomonas indicatrix]UEX18420.1 hypothetical protein LMF57_00735 [Stenotrophomonas sp. SI-NJAU-1]
MSLREKQFSFAQVISWISAACAAVAIGTWTLATHLQSNELASYKAAEAWKPLETITALREASKSVNLAANERSELVALRADGVRLRALADQVPKLSSERDRLSQELATISQESLNVTVAKGSSEYLIPNVLLLGVVRAYTHSNECEFILGNRNTSMSVGHEVEANVADSNFLLRLTAVTDTACRFSFVKSPVVAK